MKHNAITSDYAISALLQASGRTTDGSGLFVIKGKREENPYWRFSYTFDGVRKTLSLGVFPRTTLQEARNLAEEFRSMVDDGINPSDWRKSMRQKSSDRRKAEKLLKGGPPAKHSFESIALEWHESKRPKWSIGYSNTVLRRMKNHLFPSLARRHIATIGPGSVSKLCIAIQTKGSSETGIRVFKICQRIFAHGISKEHLKHNPCNDIQEVFESPVGHHLPAITEPSKLSTLLRKIQDYSGTETVKAALALKSMLMVRGGELRKAEWREFDLNLGEWRVPAVRMKGRLARKIKGEHHTVSLPTQATVILRKLYQMNKQTRSKFVFPAIRDPKNCMSGNTLNKALRGMGYSTQLDVTAHGFRATARTMIVERLKFSKDYAELQLAHTVSDPNHGAYNRVQHLPERKEMLQAWADYLDDLREGRFQPERDLDPFKPITETESESEHDDRDSAVNRQPEVGGSTSAEQIRIPCKKASNFKLSPVPPMAASIPASHRQQNSSYKA